MRAGKRPRRLAIGLMLAGMACLAAPTVRADSLDEANQLLKAGQHAKALEQVNRHLSAKPKDAQGRFLKGIILTGLDKQNEAIAIFQKLTEDYPDLPEPYNNLAVIYAQQKQYEKAKRALEMAIRTHPAYATAHENLGDIYSRLASQAYGKALQIDASNASAQTKLAMINDLVGGPKLGADKAANGKPTAAPVVTPTPTVIASAEPRPELRPEPKPEAKPAEPPAKPTPVVLAAPPKPELKPAETKPVETKPTPVAAKPEPAKPAGDAQSEVTAAVDSWISAWSKKDVRSYLAHYAKDFQTPSGQTRKEWEADRTQRVGKPGRIEVGRDRLNIRADGDKATVSFRQHYKSASFNSSSGKTLVLVKRDGKWLIQQERVGG